MTIPQPQRLEKKDNQHESAQAYVPTFWSLPTSVSPLKEPCKGDLGLSLEKSTAPGSSLGRRLEPSPRELGELLGALEARPSSAIDRAEKSNVCVYI